MSTVTLVLGVAFLCVLDVGELVRGSKRKDNCSIETT